ncbi:MAG: anti-sigma 24 factor [Burkholderiales bacterium]|nr:anti-sigma 24 factor [Burkholderiales bacterium]MDE2456574.1 anti-sigma 24 factor [Burkholderiales bacterium]
MNSPLQKAGAELSSDDADRAWLSALADGDAAGLEHACSAWRDEAEVRVSWHAYHLIGDVLRSDELASQPARDEAFLAGLRSRLAQEPVLLAPTPRRRPIWAVPAAAAAGFVVVAGAMVVARLPAAGIPDAGPVLALRAPSSAAGFTLTSNQPIPAQPIVVGARMIRDDRLDSYLRAHREALGGPVLATPGGVPRNVETLAPLAPPTAPAAAR